jgi:hypothetical protein
MTVTLHLSPDTEHRLREKAVRSGQTLEGYLYQLVEREAQTANGAEAGPADQPTSLAEFDDRLDELSAGLAALPPLPADWSRADLYGDHD